MRVRVIGEGKTKDAHLRALQADCARRIAHFTELVVEEVHAVRRSSRHLGPRGEKTGVKTLSSAERRLLERLRGSYKVFLDGRGREWNSEEFPEWLGQQALRGTRKLVFLVGGTEGFSAAFRGQANLLFALSRMTLSRDWARALLEQIYRGFTILRGYPYSR